MQVWSGDSWEARDLGAYNPSGSPPYVAAKHQRFGTGVPPVDRADCALGSFVGGTSFAPHSRLTQAILTCHYAYTQGTGIKAQDPDDDRGLELLDKVQRFRHIPCIAIHGRNDIVCPISTAYDLHQAWPEMELQVVPGAGHSQYDPRIAHCLVTATYRMASLTMSTYR